MLYTENPTILYALPVSSFASGSTSATKNILLFAVS